MSSSSSSEAASTDSEEDGPAAPRLQGATSNEPTVVAHASPRRSNLMVVRERKRRAVPPASAQPDVEPEKEPVPPGEALVPSSDRLARRREGISLAKSGSDGGDADPLQEETRAKVKQAIIVNFPNPEHPKRQEMETMLQFLQTMKDLTMFVQKYDADLGDLAKIQVEMQLKSMSIWNRKKKAIRALGTAAKFLRFASMGSRSAAEQVASMSADELLAMRRAAVQAGIDVDNMTDEQIMAALLQAQAAAEEERKMQEGDARWKMMQVHLAEAQQEKACKQEKLAQEEARKQEKLAMQEKQRKMRQRWKLARDALEKAAAVTRLSGVPQTDLERELAALDAEELRLKQQLESGLLSWEEEERIRQRLVEIFEKKTSLNAAIVAEQKARKDAARLRLCGRRNAKRMAHTSVSCVKLDVGETFAVAAVESQQTLQRKSALGFIAEALAAEKSARRSTSTSRDGRVNSLWRPDRAGIPSRGGGANFQLCISPPNAQLGRTMQSPRFVPVSASSPQSLEGYVAATIKQQTKNGVVLPQPTVHGEAMVVGASSTGSEGLESIQPRSLLPQTQPSIDPRLSPERDEQWYITTAISDRSPPARPCTAPGGRLFPARANSARAQLHTPLWSSHAGPTALISPDARGSQFFGMVFGTESRPSTSTSPFRPAEHLQSSGSPRIIHSKPCTFRLVPGGVKTRNEAGTVGAYRNNWSSHPGAHAVHSGFAGGAVLVSESSTHGLC